MRVASVHRSTLLLGFGPRTALAVARSLHRRGVRVVVALVADWERPLGSRAIARYVVLPPAERPQAEFVAALRRTIADEAIDLILPITDGALARLAPHLDELRPHATIMCPDAGTIARLLSKEATEELARSLGVPVPRSIALPPGGLGAPVPLAFPLFAKTGDAGDELYRLRARLEDAAALAAFVAGPDGQRRNLRLQEYAPGDDVGLAVLARRGERVAAFQYRALRTEPAEGGMCVLARTEPVDPRMLAGAERMLRALAWEGVAQFDFRHDPATDRFVLLEINARFWGTTAVAVAAGMDFPWLLWTQLHGVEPEVPAAYRHGLRMRWLEGDVRRLVERWRSRRQRRPGEPSMAREIGSFLAATRPGVGEMVWSWRDPGPMLEEAWHFTRCWGLARWRRVWRRGR